MPAIVFLHLYFSGYFCVICRVHGHTFTHARGILWMSTRLVWHDREWRLERYGLNSVYLRLPFCFSPKDLVRIFVKSKTTTVCFVSGHHVGTNCVWVCFLRHFSIWPFRPCVCVSASCRAGLGWARLVYAMWQEQCIVVKYKRIHCNIIEIGLFLSLVVFTISLWQSRFHLWHMSGCVPAPSPLCETYLSHVRVVCVCVRRWCTHRSPARFYAVNAMLYRLRCIECMLYGVYQISHLIKRSEKSVSTENYSML